MTILSNLFSIDSQYIVKYILYLPGSKKFQIFSQKLVALKNILDTAMTESQVPSSISIACSEGEAVCFPKQALKQGITPVNQYVPETISLNPVTPSKLLKKYVIK